NHMASCRSWPQCYEDRLQRTSRLSLGDAWDCKIVAASAVDGSASCKIRAASQVQPTIAATKKATPAATTLAMPRPISSGIEIPAASDRVALRPDRRRAATKQAVINALKAIMKA